MALKDAAQDGDSAGDVTATSSMPWSVRTRFQCDLHRGQRTLERRARLIHGDFSHDAAF